VVLRWAINSAVHCGQACVQCSAGAHQRLRWASSPDHQSSQRKGHCKQEETQAARAQPVSKQPLPALHAPVPLLCNFAGVFSLHSAAGCGGGAVCAALLRSLLFALAQPNASYVHGRRLAACS
jgi:hypothetical protein